jgi:hypothetical protein
MKIVIETIPHDSHRYETVGDWWYDKDGTMQIRVSDMKNWKYELLVAVHELVEQSLCKDRKVTEDVVTKFDKKFEKERSFGQVGEDEEAGDDPRAPYRKEHFFATNIERLLSEQLGIDWKTYDDTVMKL